MRLYIPSGLNSKPFASQGREPLIIHFWLLVALEISMTTQIIIEASISICDYFFLVFLHRDRSFHVYTTISMVFPPI